MRTRSSYWNSPAGDVGLNMTPMIDCTFQLLLFFILAGQMASQALTNLDLPRPLNSQAVHAAAQSKSLIINVISAEDQNASDALCYEVDGLRVATNQTSKVTELIRARLAGAGNALAVEVRADRRVGYGQVYPLLSAISAAGATRVNVTALLEGHSNGPLGE